jgi:hypothetical protein
MMHLAAACSGLLGFGGGASSCQLAGAQHVPPAVIAAAPLHTSHIRAGHTSTRSTWPYVHSPQQPRASTAAAAAAQQQQQHASRGLPRTLAHAVEQLRALHSVRQLWEVSKACA